MAEVRSRVHRILKPLARFQEFQDGFEWPAGLEPAPVLAASETALGVYSDEPTNLSEAIVFTTHGFYLRRDNELWLYILYSDIERAVPPSAKSGVTGFDIFMRDGSKLWLPVKASKDGRFFDAFEVLRFLDRVKEDLVAK